MKSGLEFAGQKDCEIYFPQRIAITLANVISSQVVKCAELTSAMTLSTNEAAALVDVAARKVADETTLTGLHLNNPEMQQH